MGSGSTNPLFDGRVGATSNEDICAYAETLFQRIRAMIVERVVPATLKSCFLDPIRSAMAVDTSIDIFSKSDDDFLSLFVGKNRRFGLW